MTTLATVRPTFLQDASLHRFSVSRYLRMVDTGVFDDEDQVELLEGYLVQKMTRKPQHDLALELLMEATLAIRPAGWRLRIQSGLELTDSVPEPDLALVRRGNHSPRLMHPQPAEIGLLVEVADTSLVRDTQDKTRIYARAGIPRYWVVDLIHRRVIAYSDPTGPVDAPAYANAHIHAVGECVPLVLDDCHIGDLTVTDLLPPE